MKPRSLLLACGVFTSCFEAPVAEVAKTWRSQLGDLLPLEVPSVTVIENDWDRQMRLFSYTLPAGHPAESSQGLATRFAKHHPCYEVVSQSTSDIHFRCSDEAKQKWWAEDYAFHVCPGGRTVIGLGFSGHVSRYERESMSKAAEWKCGHL